MSRHWKPRARRRPRFSSGEIRLTVLAGTFLGLMAAAASSWWPAAPEAADFRSAPVPDHWAESKRSAQIFEAQQGSAFGSRAAEREPPVVAAAVTIVDGDTFRLAGETIRIADIDTPEVRGRCPEESALAARATRRMDELLQAGPFELHGVERDEDRYGRKLRIVTRDGRSLGDVLVAEGLARTWTGRREPWCAEA